MAFAIFLEYLPELKKGPEFLVAGFDRSIFHLGGRLNYPDLPFLLRKLLPWMSVEEFQRAKLQLKNTIEENEEIFAHADAWHHYNPQRLQTFSNVIDEAI